MFSFYILTYRTFRNIFCYLNLHSVPPIIFLQAPIHLGTSWMYCISRILSFFHNLMRKFYFWYTQSIPNIKVLSFFKEKSFLVPFLTSSITLINYESCLWASCTRSTNIVLTRNVSNKALKSPTTKSNP